MTKKSKNGIIPPESDFQVSPDGFARIEHKGCPQVVCRVEDGTVFFWSKAYKEEAAIPAETVVERILKAANRGVP